MKTAGLFFAAIGVIIAVRSADADDVEFSDIQSAWEACLLRVVSGTQMEIHGVIQSSGGNQVREWRFGAELQAPNAFLSTPIPSGGERVMASNEDYRFVLNLASQDEATLVKYDFKKPPHMGHDGSQGPHGDRTFALAKSLVEGYRGLAIDGTWLPNIVSDPSFRTESLTLSSDDTCEWEFSYDPSTGSPKIRGGRLVLAPNAGYLVLRGVVDATWADTDGTIKISNELSFLEDGTPYVSRQVAANRNKDEKVIATTTISVSAKKLKGRTSDSKYRLSAYGISEPTLPKRRRSVFLWIGGALVLVLFAVLLRRKSRA